MLFLLQSTLKLLKNSGENEGLSVWFDPNNRMMHRFEEEFVGKLIDGKNLVFFDE